MVRSDDEIHRHAANNVNSDFVTKFFCSEHIKTSENDVIATFLSSKSCVAQQRHKYDRYIMTKKREYVYVT